MAICKRCNGPLWRCEFGEAFAPPAEIQALVDSGEAEDISWHNDCAPAFGLLDTVGDEVVRIWFDHPDPQERENDGDVPMRYAVTMRAGQWNAETVLETNDAKEAVAKYRECVALAREALAEFGEPLPDPKKE